MGGHGGHGGHNRRRLLVVLTITAAVMVAEVVTGLFTGSLALLADAGHMFTDVAGIALALVTITVAERTTTRRSTYGLFRLEIFAAATNAVVLLAVAGWVLATAIPRLTGPPAVHGGPMVVVAAVGLVANTVSLRVLSPSQEHSLNVRAAYLEVLGDLLGSAAVVVSGLLILFAGLRGADPAASILVALLIVPRTWGLLREAVDILMESTPRGISLDVVRAHITGVDGVVDSHDLHVWTISSQRLVMSAHVVVADEWLARSGEVLDALQRCLAEHFDVGHCTFQIEPHGHLDHEPLGHE